MLSAEAGVGARAPRLEDGRLLRGRGRFVDDVDVVGQLQMRVLRAEVASALIAAIDVEAARAHPRVRAVLTAADLPSDLRIPLRLDFGVPLEPWLQPVLAIGRVRYVGEPVAVVVAEDAYAAEDAAELIEVTYEALPVVLDARAALEPGAPVLHEGAESNQAALVSKEFGEVEAAFEAAAVVVSDVVEIGRHSGVPLETRGLLADPDPGRDHLTIHGASLVTHYHRRVLTKLLEIPTEQLHMRNTDVGGNFGVRGDFFPEDFLVPYLARQLGRPVKWVEDRAENLVATNHARQQIHDLALAFDADGILLGMRAEVWHDKGAYIRPTGLVISEITVGMLPWPYRVPAYRGSIHAVVTNKTPLGPYRAPGRYELTYARERLLDCAAAKLELDPVELRMRNLLTTAEMPHTPELSVGGEPFTLNCGDYDGLLRKATAAAGLEEWRREAAELRAQGRVVGAGLAYFMDKSGLGVYETAGLDVGVDGSVRVLIGGASSGQGIETVMAQIVATELGVSLERVEVVHGDTDLIPDGVGSWSSRSTVIGGSAVLRAAESTAAKARRVAADMLEASLDDLVLEEGRVHVAGSPDRGVSLAEIAAACTAVESAERGEAPGLGAREIYVDPVMNYPYGVACAQVEIDRETGGLLVHRYHVTYEIGKAVNPMLVEGQIVGGVAQGLGGALLEEFRYDAEGQPQAASFMDYLMPTAGEVPAVGTLILEDAPTPTNPLGAKGAGESGIMAVGAAVANAVGDALERPGAVRALPLRPERVRDLLDDLAGNAANV